MIDKDAARKLDWLEVDRLLVNAILTAVAHGEPDLPFQLAAQHRLAAQSNPIPLDPVLSERAQGLIRTPGQ